MLDSIMSHINNHFARSVESAEYEIVSDGIVGTFGEKYVVGQYVWIRWSIVNDGVYKITAKTSNKLTLDATLFPENEGVTIAVFGLNPPIDFLTVATEITAYTSKDGVVSESIDDYGVSYGSEGGGWTSVFKGKLSAWKRMYDDDVVMVRQYNIDTKGCYR